VKLVVVGVGRRFVVEKTVTFKVSTPKDADVVLVETPELTVVEVKGPKVPMPGNE
jgi:hypothetical protein